MQNLRDDKLEKQLMPVLRRNRNNRVAVFAFWIKFDPSGDDKVMAFVDQFIGLIKRLLTRYEVRC